MPAAIPLVIMAAGAVAQKVAKDKQAKKQAANNKTAIGDVNNLNRGFGDKLAGIGDENRAQNGSDRGAISGGLDEMWNSASQPGTFHDPYMSESQPFYKNAMNTGLFDEGQKNDFRARGALQNDALFAGAKRQLDQGANIRGGGFAGYSGQSAALQRDAARQGEENRLNTESSLQGQIRQNMFSGASGVTRNDESFQGAQRDVDNSRNAFGLQQGNQRLGILGARQDLRTQGTNDLPYYSGAGSAYRGVEANPEYAGPGILGTIGAGAEAAGAAYGGGGGMDQYRPKATNFHNEGYGGMSNYGSSGAGPQYNIGGYASSANYGINPLTGKPR